MRNVRPSLNAVVLSLLIVLLGAAHLTSTVKIVGRWLPIEALFGQKSGLTTKPLSKSNIIQVALLLDTSNSMDGLIEQAKSQLWSILGELTRMKKGGESPELGIALYEYGNLSLPLSSGYIRQVTPFTKDMDLISEVLFALKTNGGDEYCGQVIHSALEALDWETADGSLRLIYIAGNEPFTQGPFPYAEACALAKEKGITVNTIYCGDASEGINSGWKNGADITGGAFATINQDSRTVYVESPYDTDISKLNDELNKTYLAYGAQGLIHQEKQIAQDANAGKYSQANAADRAYFKASKQYSNEKWDLVDAYKKDKTIVTKKEQLPDSLKQLSQTEVEARIEYLSAKRDDVQQQIRKLNEKRLAFIQQRAQDKQEAQSLENSILQSLRKQAKARGFEVE